ncbi:hypothetical protein GCM10009801_37990 [Streptomyces albiaxialis]|uniref:Prolyl 4-hydroxylase alpha subunit Fe(2+) 2OG dioxygenase domain-containing protein n=1 Tax=Streptomyces albiaxialis TaxID=329523 RepID=A0ABP5HMX9_9ACTN
MNWITGATLIRTVDEVLPDGEADRLRNAVERATEPERLDGASSYHTTFWYAKESAPGNAVEKVIDAALRPLVPASVEAGLAGTEWWLGRLAPPYSANFAFGAHHDVGRNPATGEFENPLLSSVFYLTSVDDGALTVFTGEPDLAAPDREFVFPRANMFAMFPGTRWHAVASREDVLGKDAPHPPGGADGGLRLTVTVNWWHFRPESHAAGPMRQIAGDYTGEIYPELREEPVSAGPGPARPS